MIIINIFVSNLFVSLFTLISVSSNKNISVSCQNIRFIYLNMNILNERVKVYCRVRPFLSNEIDNTKYIKEIDVNKGRFSLDNINNTKIYSMDYFFSENSIQNDIYNVIGLPIVQAVLHGFNGTIMAYGQTGAGKTYTMLGQEFNVFFKLIYLE